MSAQSRYKEFVVPANTRTLLTLELISKEIVEANFRLRLAAKCRHQNHIKKNIILGIVRDPFRWNKNVRKKRLFWVKESIENEILWEQMSNFRKPFYAHT